MIIELLAFGFGASLLYYFSPKVVKHSSNLAKSLRVDPLIIGLLIIGIGTSLPEIINSIIASLTGHADINAGNAIGSSIVQISLVFGLSILISGKLKTKRNDILFIGGCAIISAILGTSMLLKGYLSRMDGVFLILSYFIFIYFIHRSVKKYKFKIKTEEMVFKAKTREYALRTIYSITGIVIGSIISVLMIIRLSDIIGLSEFFLSFILMSINTSIPELFICLAALREKEYGIAIGDIFGSNIADITLSLGIGPILTPNILSQAVSRISSIYLVLITLIITTLLANKRIINRKESLIMIGLYFLSFPLMIFY